MYHWMLIVSLAALSGGRVIGLSEALEAPAPQGHVTVEPTLVRIGETDFLPRFATFLPNSLVVPAGQVVTLPPDSTWNAIEVAGTLRVSRTTATKLRTIHLLVLPGGYLDVGTVDDCVQAPVEIIFRDVPIDTAKDPFQWGNGLVNFGRQTRVHCDHRQPWAELAEDALVGATSLTLTAAPAGWRVGDELLIPDTRMVGPRYSNDPAPGPRREAPVFITSVAGTFVGLSRPLSFSHLAVPRPDGSVVLRPRVVNLTRSMVLRSENPKGTRGHTADIGHDASWDIRGNQFVGLGRTRALNLHNTSADLLQVGTNQLGKYASHAHHAGSSLSVRRMAGNSFQGTFGSKWAHAIHGSHDTIVTGNVCTDFQGGCFATEDGYESRNQLVGNFAAYSSAATAQNASELVDAKIGNDCPGCEGSGFWFRGLANVIEGNEAWNNVTGINLFFQRHIGVGTLVPTVPGGTPDTPFVPEKFLPVRVRGNVTASNLVAGLEFWTAPRFLVEQHTSAHNGLRQVWPSASAFWATDLIAIASENRSLCVLGSSGYIPTMEIIGGELRGCGTGVSDGIANLSAAFRNLSLQNVMNLHMSATGWPFQPKTVILENLVEEPLGPPPPVPPPPPPPPPPDSDGDGVPDTRDECPNTPAGVHVDFKGCPA